MSLPRKGSRLIVVDGISYRWYVRKKPSYSLCYGVWNGETHALTFAVEHAEAKGSTLVVTLPQIHPGVGNFPIVPVLPSQVAHYISEALRMGWKATISGKTFNLGKVQ